MADTKPSSRPAAEPGDPIDLSTSVAGEEDPGASIDLANSPGRADQPGGQGAKQAAGARPPMSPGDQAPAGTPGTGEDVGPRCGGSGKLGASACPECQGTGKVNVGIGGA